MLFIAVNNEHDMLAFRRRNFTKDVPARKLRTQKSPGRIHQKIAS